MERSIKVAVIVTISLGLAACMSTPSLRKPVERERVYAKPADAVWEAVITNLARSGAIIGNTDKASGLITYTKILSSGELTSFTSPDQLTGAFGGGRFSQGSGYMTVLIKPVEESKTEVFINGRIQVRSTLLNFRGEPSQVTHFALSNGKLEDEFLDQLALEMGEKEFPFLKKRAADKKPVKGK